MPHRAITLSSLVFGAVPGVVHGNAFPPSGNIDPDAPCQDATDASCCENNKYAVMGGVDFVSIVEKKQGADNFDWGSKEYNAILNGYTFNFISAENADKFKADPWLYAPKYGAF